MVAEVTSVGVRRVPRQNRSEQRFELILDTAAALIDEIGYANVTTSIIANRIDMSGPGIYRYFNGLPAIATALAARNLTRFVERVSTALTTDISTWPDALARTVAIYYDLHRTEPGFRWLRLGDTTNRQQNNTTARNHALAARALTDLLTTRYPVGPSDNLLQRIEVIVEIIDSLTARAFASSLDDAPFFIDETSRMVTRYLQDYLSTSADERHRGL